MKTLLAVLFSVLAIPAVAQQKPSLERAELYRKHGLVADAKREAINLMTADGVAVNQVMAARMLLAQLAIAENRVADAVELWNLVALAKGEHAEAAKSLLERFADVQVASAKSTVQNAVAASYIDAANFWVSSRIPSQLTIDTSWLDNTGAAVEWFNKCIAEFPKTRAAEIAYESIIRVHVGKAGDRYSNGLGALDALSDLKAAKESRETRKSLGLSDNGAVEKCQKRVEESMAKAMEALASFEAAMPESASLQRMRFTVVQAYWLLDDREGAEPLLDAMIKADGDRDTFWKQLATMRKAVWRR